MSVRPLWYASSFGQLALRDPRCDRREDWGRKSEKKEPSSYFDAMAPRYLSILRGAMHKIADSVEHKVLATIDDAAIPDSIRAVLRKAAYAAKA